MNHGAEQLPYQECVTDITPCSPKKIQFYKKKTWFKKADLLVKKKKKSSSANRSAGVS